MNSYDQLDINQKIQFKAALQAWTKYTVVNFKEKLDSKVYGLRISGKKQIQRTSLGAGYRFGTKKGRTNKLRSAWWDSVNPDAGQVLIEFLQYGRYLDMGVGRGTSHTDRQVNRILKLGRSPRTRRAWYSKTKTHQIKRLREILAAQNIHLMLDTLESVLELSVTVNL